MTNLRKKTTLFVCGIFLTGISYTFGQLNENPTNRNFVLDSKTLYEHGYNKDNLSTPDASRENTDTVMVNSVMNYFVMPLEVYNTAYFQQNNYNATNLTASEFLWSVTNGNSFAAQSPNATNTSPWIKATWSALGAATLTVKEAPQGLPGTCDSEPTQIPVFVIPKPTIGFNQVGSPLGYEAFDCYDETAVLTASYNFAFNVTTSSSEVLIDYTIRKKDLATGSVVSTTPVTNASITLTPVSGNTYIATLPLNFNDYGDYEITIDKITDRIARKCDLTGDINNGENVFTYSVLPQPRTNPIYHIPNNF
jgi:hypothetical protein